MKTLREHLDNLEKTCKTVDDLASHCDSGLKSPQEGAGFYQGKVRDIVDPHDGTLIVYHSDRLSAFDRFIGYVPLKGEILSRLTEAWFTRLPKSVLHHFIESIDARTIRVKKTAPVRVEVVVRNYLAGSLLRAYQRGERTVCGVTFPDGLKPYQKFETPIITPSTKAAAFEHDEEISEKEILERSLCTETQWEQIKETALNVFAFGTRELGKSGWILADTKYEFGIDRDGNILLIDEIHTPDSSRFWIRETLASRLANGQEPEMLDKEIIRRRLMALGFKGEGDVPTLPVKDFCDLARVYLRVLESLQQR